MRRAIHRKLNNRGSTNVLIVVAIVVIVALLVILLIPVVRAWLGKGAAEGCDLARRRTLDMLRYEKNMDSEMDLAKAREYVRTKGSFCPAGGDFHVIEDPDDVLGVTVVCGIHDADTGRRTRLNSADVLDQLQAALAEAKRLGDPAPDAVTVTLNSQSLTVERTDADPGITRGTYLTPGYEGTVAFYILGEDGELSWFCFADPDHCIYYRPGFGWSGEGAS